MRAVAIAGPKKSGKSTLVALLAEALEKRGHSVAIIKHSSKPLEKANTDAFWFMRPGRTVAGVSPEETAIFWPQQLDFAEITSLVRADVALIEGGEVPCRVPRILCLKEGGKKEISALCNKQEAEIIATQGEKPAVPCNGPHFAEIDPETAEQLAGLILEKGLDLPRGEYACVPKNKSKNVKKDPDCTDLISVHCDGKDVALSPEAVDAISKSLRAVLAAPLQDGPGREVTIHFRPGRCSGR